MTGKTREQQLVELLRGVMTARRCANASIVTALQEVSRRLFQLANDDRIRLAFVRTLVDTQLVPEPDHVVGEDAIADFLNACESYRAELLVSVAAIDALSDVIDEALEQTPKVN